MNSVNLAFALLLTLVLVSALAVVHARHNSRVVFSSLQAEKAVRDNWEVQYGQLQLEKGAWATHGRIERMARSELKMNIPSQQSVVLIRQ